VADAGPEDLRKENLRLARRVHRLEATTEHLEQIRDTNGRLLERLMTELDAERARSHSLLLNILPQPIINRLNGGEKVIADRYEEVSVLFSDFVGFTTISSRMPVAELVAQLNALFSRFDNLCEELGVEKIKTIGDAYMAASGLPGTRSDHAVAMAEMALGMREAVREVGETWQVRIGIHTGPVVAGVIGSRKFVYDLWGDTVNVASRMESNSLPDRIQVSSAAAGALTEEYELEARGEIDLKGKGLTEAFFLERRRAAPRGTRQPRSRPRRGQAPG
jgi:adenylate cyclase